MRHDSCPYHAPVMPLSCPYHAPIMPLSCPYHAPVMPVQAPRTGFLLEAPLPDSGPEPGRAFTQREALESRAGRDQGSEARVSGVARSLGLSRVAWALPRGGFRGGDGREGTSQRIPREGVEAGRLQPSSHPASQPASQPMPRGWGTDGREPLRREGGGRAPRAALRDKVALFFFFFFFFHLCHGVLFDAIPLPVQ